MRDLGSRRGVKVVSILAQPEGRALHPLRDARAVALHVSILAQPEGRALPVVCPVMVVSGTVFQSSPSPKAGRSLV